MTRPLHIVTHSGSFHADDVLAVGLVRAFVDPAATVERTRDPARIAAADVVVDVGGEFDPSTRRFDHHQRTYEGSYSSAGMVLAWLAEEGHVEPELAERLRAELVDYVDAVDNGRRTPEFGVPCFPSIVGALGEANETRGGYDALFEEAAQLARGLVLGIQAGYRAARDAHAEVEAAMNAAIASGGCVVELSRYVKWKPAYYALGGETHPTDYVAFPGERDYRVIAVAPTLGSFEEKRPFPESWAGLEGEALSAVTGVPGAIFCHKNRFIAVFASREVAFATLSRWGLTHRERGCGGG
ncbi:MAG: MYG1 family protein [Polyangiales bacterium]|nr:MYG1 family protein [Myxococcales bacterium]MCB9657124.1 MYG1 family protein [Sandaracinaceae bacterium]